jgi:hypothetical protein
MKRIIIASPHCSKINLIEYQYKSIKKYVLDKNYEYFIFNDGSCENSMLNFHNNEIRDNIRDKCSQLNINCIDIPQELHTNRNKIFENTKCVSSNNASARASVSVQYIYNYFKDNDCILFIIESDMLFINYINLENYIGNTKIKFLPQSRTKNDITIRYMWIGILCFNFKNLENKHELQFDCGAINDINLDSGGYSYFYLEKNKIDTCDANVNYCLLNKFESLNKNNFTDEFYDLCYDINKFYNGCGIFGEVYLENCLYHIRTFGSNWNYASIYFKNYIENIGINYNCSWEIKSIYWKKYMDVLDNIIKSYVQKISNEN